MQRQRAEVAPPVALTIAGSDSGGGAGIQADLKTMEAHDVFGTSVITATTAQNTQGVHGTEVLPTDHIADQYTAVVDDLRPGAIKTGMLATAGVIETVAELTDSFSGPIVVDPVMVAATGDRLLTADGEDAYDPLVSDATVVTPNADEAAVLLDRSVSDPDQAREAAVELVEIGATAALVKGGHLDGDVVVDSLAVDADTNVPEPTDIDATVDTRVDRSSSPGTIVQFKSPRVRTDGTHGSGCALSSGIAARLARGETLIDAIAGATAFVGRALRYGLAVGNGPGAVHHLVDLRERAERGPTAEALESVVSRLDTPATRPLASGPGLAVVGATAYADSPSDVATLEGRVQQTPDGVTRARGVRYGVDTRASRVLLGARESRPDYRFAARIAADLEIEFAEILPEEVIILQGDSSPNGTSADANERLAGLIRRGLANTPEAVCAVDQVGVGGSRGVYLFGTDSAALTRRLVAVRDAAAEQEQA